MRAHLRKCISPRRVASGCAVTLVLMLAAACGRSDPPTAPFLRTPKTEPSATTAVTGTDTEHAISNYRMFWEVWVQANDPPNASFPALVELATSGELLLVRSNIEAVKAKHEIFRNRPDSRRSHRITVLQATTDQIILQDCNVDDGLVLDSRTLATTNEAVSTHLWRATMTKEGGHWKLSDNTQIQKWVGESECASEPAQS